MKAMEILGKIFAPVYNDYKRIQMLRTITKIDKKIAIAIILIICLQRCYNQFTSIQKRTIILIIPITYGIAIGYMVMNLSAP